MNEIELRIANLNHPQPQNETFSLILKEKESSNYISVVIGMHEAKVIIMETNHIKMRRPLAHDLFIQLCNQANFSIEKILIYDFIDGIYYVHIMVSENGKSIVIDSRLSDAVIIAIKNDIPIFILQNIFETNAINPNNPFSDLNVCEIDQDDEFLFVTANLEEGDHDDESEYLNSLTISELEDMLNKAIQEEQYEWAAQIDEEINRRKSHGK